MARHDAALPADDDGAGGWRADLAGPARQPGRCRALRAIGRSGAVFWSDTIALPIRGARPARGGIAKQGDGLERAAIPRRLRCRCWSARNATARCAAGAWPNQDRLGKRRTRVAVARKLAVLMHPACGDRARPSIGTAERMCRPTSDLNSLRRGPPGAAGRTSSASSSRRRANPCCALSRPPAGHHAPELGPFHARNHLAGSDRVQKIVAAGVARSIVFPLTAITEAQRRISWRFHRCARGNAMRSFAALRTTKVRLGRGL